MNAMWRLVKHGVFGHIIVPSSELASRLICSYCLSVLLYHQFICFKRNVYPYLHCDVHFKCPKCGYFVTFGLSISEEDYRKLVGSPLHGKVLDGDTAIKVTELFITVPEKEKEIIKERMRRWEYW